MTAFFLRIVIPISVLATLAGCARQPSNERVIKKPNIIYILADDLGYGDLSCYGQKRFATPNIDSLAMRGIRFTQHYAGSSVCAPSRSALLTGMHTGHTPIRGNKGVAPEGQWPLPDSVTTLTELLQQSGYTTGVFGKWGLGFPGSEGDPGKQGVDNFFGYNCQKLAHNYFPYHLWEDGSKIILTENAGEKTGAYAPHLIQRKALDFIEENKDDSFFLMYATPLPHAELLVPEDLIAPHRGRYDPEQQYEGVDGGKDFRQGPYGSQSEAHAAYAAMVTLLDMQVGEIVAKLRELGIEENTLIIFSSDNGPHQEGGGDPDYFDSNSIFRGVKRDLYEGGIRVPMIAVWPGTISAGEESDHVSAFWDVLPTLAEVAGASITEGTDGISFLPALKQQSQEKHEYLYWEFHEMGGRQAVRMGDWKAIRYNVNTSDPGETELYDLANDPGEMNNIASANPEKVAKMDAVLDSARVPSPVFTFSSETIIN